MCFRCGLIVGKWFVYAVHTINILGPRGGLWGGYLTCLWNQPLIFFLWGRPMDLLGRDKVVHCGKDWWS